MASAHSPPDWVRAVRVEDRFARRAGLVGFRRGDTEVVLPDGRHDATFIVAGWNGRLRVADSTGRCNTLETAQAAGVLQMKQRRRIYYTESQKALCG